MKRLCFLCALISCAILAVSCARSHYPAYPQSPPETVVRTDTVTRVLSSGDTVRIIERVYESDSRFDSIAPILDSLNRVIGWDRYHFRKVTKLDARLLEHLQSLVDSLRAVRQDSVSVPVPYPVEKKVCVEKKLSTWQQFRISAFWPLAAALMAAMAYIFRRPLLRLLCRLKL